MQRAKQLLIKHPNTLHYAVIAVVASVVVWSLWAKYGYTWNSADLRFHIGRNAGTFLAWEDGQIIPQINPLALDELGYGVNIFYGPLSSMIVATLYAVTHSLWFAYNFFISVIVFVTGFLMRKFVRDVTHNESIATLAALCYLSTYFLNFTIYFMQDEGGLVAYAFMPLLFDGLYRIVNRQKRGALFVAISATIIVTSHILSAFLGVIFTVIFLLLNIKKLKKSTFASLGRALALTLGFSSYFLFPFYRVYKSGLYGVFDKSVALMHRTVDAMNGSRFDFSILSGNNQRQTLQFVMVVCLIIAMFVYNRRVKHQSSPKLADNFLLQSTIIGVFSFLLTTKLIDWQYAPDIFTNLQTPFRFSLIASVFISIVNAYAVYWLAQRLVSVVRNIKLQKVLATALSLALTVGIGFSYVRQQWKEEPYWDISSVEAAATNPGASVDEYISYNAISSLETNARVPEVVHQDSITDKPPIISEFTHSGTHSSFTVTPLLDDPYASTNYDNTVDITVPSLYYEGYKAKTTDGKNLKVSPSSNGLVQITIPAEYLGEVKVHFGVSLATAVGYCISILTIAFTIIMLRRKNVV